MKTIIALMIFASLVWAQSPASAPNEEHLPLRVLYAGNAGTAYTAAWRRFLDRHVDLVRVMSASDVTAKDLDGIDVLLIDGEVIEGEGNDTRIKSERFRLTLDDLQGRPVLLMGGQGGLFADELSLKTSWQYG